MIGVVVCQNECPEGIVGSPSVLEVNQVLIVSEADRVRRIIGLCQAAVAEAVEAYGKIDILFCCTSEGKPVLRHIPSLQPVSPY